MPDCRFATVGLLWVVGRGLTRVYFRYCEASRADSSIGPRHRLSFSHIRPHGDRVATTSGLASGPISFMLVLNLSTEVIKQRRHEAGCQHEHPARGPSRHPGLHYLVGPAHEMTNFTLSVGLIDRFMRAVRQGRSYTLMNPRTGKQSDRSPLRCSSTGLLRRLGVQGNRAPCSSTPSTRRIPRLISALLRQPILAASNLFSPMNPARSGPSMSPDS
jgi:hypothetical protein